MIQNHKPTTLAFALALAFTLALTLFSYQLKYPNEGVEMSEALKLKAHNAAQAITNLSRKNQKE